MVTDHISTEEAERIAESLDFDCKCHKCASSASQMGANALRSLAAERDELKNETSVTVCGGDHARRWLAMADGCPMCLADENERLREALRATRDFIRYAANSEGGIVAQTINPALGEEDR